MEKSAEAYRTISEVAEELKLPQHVLRFWETRFPQVKPLKRAGGRRFYRPDDVALLRAIKTLLYGQGYTIKGVQRMLREQGPRGIVATCPVVPGGPVPWSAPPQHDKGDDMPNGDPRGAGPSGRPLAAAGGATGPFAPRAAADGAASPSLDDERAGDLRALIRAVAIDLSECRRLIAAARSS